MVQFKEFKAFLPNTSCFEEIPVLNPHLFPSANTNEKSFSKIMVQSPVEAKKEFQHYIEKGWIQQERKSSFYLYQQENKVFPFQKYTGIIGICSTKDFNEGKIIPHEKTIFKRETQFLNYLKQNPIQAEPICLIAENKNLSENLLLETKHKPLASFDANGLVHRFWKVQTNAVFKEVFTDTSLLFVADGHHRLSSVVRYQNEINPDADGLLAFVIPSTEIGIFPYHREILLNETEVQKLNNYLAENNFKLIKTVPKKLVNGQVLININGEFHLKTYTNEDLTLKLINDSLFNKTLAVKHSKKLKYVPGEKPISELIQIKRANLLQVFLPKIQFEQLKKISKSNKNLPPKSTWILPKLPTGLCIYSM